MGDRADAHNSPRVGEQYVSLVHGEGLGRWKQERLAYHHAYFALLDKAFSRWKHATLVRRRRRQCVVAACRVGAKFFQRLYWNQWIAMVACRRAAREAASRVLSALSIKIRLQAAWTTWKEATAASRPIRHAALPLIDRMATERRLQARGVRVQKRSTHSATVRTTPKLAKADQRFLVRAKRIDSLKKVTVYFTQRHYFQLWQAAARAVAQTISRQLGDQADAFRLGSAWRRWHRGFQARSAHRTASRQAVFFLYYHLTKSSLAKLRRFADRERRERGVSIVVSNRVRRRRLSSAFTMWRQRIDAKLVFAEWREVVRNASRHHSNPQLRVIYDIVRGLGSRRLLHQCFSTWLDQSTRRKRCRGLAHVLDGPVAKISMLPAFRLWQRQTVTEKQLQGQLQARARDRLRLVWFVWTRFVKEKETRERQRRTATRFWYYRSLRKGFSAFQALHVRWEEINATVDAVVRANVMGRKRERFQRWVAWCARRRQNQEAAFVAHHHHGHATLERTFRVLKQLRQEAQRRELIAIAHAQTITRRKLQDAFDTWRCHHTQERRRTRELMQILSSHIHARELCTKRLVFDALDEHAKVKQSRRLVNAHARGHFQSQLLRRAFATWVSSVAQLKWDHIFTQRACHFYHQNLAGKCFRQWKTNVAAVRQYRENTRVALHHWKRVRERVAFDGWKRYVANRRRQRERMHQALEFRHRAHIRDGLSHWMAGAAQLQQQRGRRTVEMQATHTERVWRKVRALATHWRYITQRNKRRAREELLEPCGRGRVAADEISRGGRRDTRMQVDQHHRDRALLAASVIHHDTRGSDLSEFVLLPRKRPRPRKPIELILETDVYVGGLIEGVENQTGYDRYRTVETVNRQYGFRFPLAPTTISDERSFSHRPAQDGHGSINPDRFLCAEPAAPVAGTVVEAGESTIDELEQRLLHWQTHRERLKQLRQSLVDFRQLLHQAATEGNLTPHELEFMRSRVRTMEQQEAASRRRWYESRPEILSLAQRIKHLRGAMTASA